MVVEWWSNRDRVAAGGAAGDRLYPAIRVVKWWSNGNGQMVVKQR
jgi:hypothetical protein